MTNRTQILRENAGDDMQVSVPRPPDFVVKGRVSCGHCGTSHEPYNRYDTFPQCPLCGKLIDLSALVLHDAEETVLPDRRL